MKFSYQPPFKTSKNLFLSISYRDRPLEETEFWGQTSKKQKWYLNYIKIMGLHAFLDEARKKIKGII